MSKYIILSFFLVLSQNLKGQGVYPITSSHAGYAVLEGQGSVSWSVGQVNSLTRVSSDDAFQISEGIQQPESPYLLVGTKKMPTISELGIRLFPNPVKDFIEISFTKELPDKVLISDFNGRLLKSYSINESLRMDIGDLPGQSYILTFFFDKNQIRSSLPVIKVAE